MSVDRDAGLLLAHPDQPVEQQRIPQAELAAQRDDAGSPGWDRKLVAGAFPYLDEGLGEPFELAAGGGQLGAIAAADEELPPRVWSPGEPLERGIWNILVPARGPAVQPDIVVAPAVGFDSENYRLGYGGGFFDRTLAAMAIKPMILGVGYADSKLATIYPQPHDIPMDAIITD
ncbi:MAG TPA: 5-formyltetrahydrofolate cyclo-ligase [Burkholderiales bacterium]